MAPLQKTIYTGTFIYTPTLGSLSISEHLAIGVDEEGVIRHITDLPPDGELHDRDDSEDETKRVKAAAVKWGWGETGWKWVVGGKQGRSWWFPGFVDTHIHAPQYPNIGLFGKTTLLSWLKTYTYPLESSLASPTKAHNVYTACVSRTLTHGTTTAAYFATAHASSTNILASICLAHGQRAFIGRVCMDTDLSPPSYRDPSPAFAISETQAVIAHIDAIDPDHKLLMPILTPRFAPSCSSTLLSNLGALAQETELPIQTHIAENPSECALVADMFPDASSYADVYATYNLLTSKTVLAHGIHLSPSERALLKKNESKISHCPVSNTALSSGLCPVRTLLDEGITIGLGTDVSGGYSPSVLVAAREACMVSRTLAALVSNGDVERTATKELTAALVSNRDVEMEGKEGEEDGDKKKLSVEEVLYLATRGGAECLGLGDKIGAFEVGMEWDAQLVVLRSHSDDGDVRSPSDVRSYDDGRSHEDERSFDDGRSQGEDRRQGADRSYEDDGERKYEGDEGPIDLWGEETWEEKVAKWVFGGDDRNTKMVFVRGVCVFERR